MLCNRLRLQAHVLAKLINSNNLVLLLLDAGLREVDMQRWLNPGLLQAVPCAVQRAAVDGDDGAAGAQIWANRPAVSQTALKMVIWQRNGCLCKFT